MPAQLPQTVVRPSFDGPSYIPPDALTDPRSMSRKTSIGSKQEDPLLKEANILLSDLRQIAYRDGCGDETDFVSLEDLARNHFIGRSGIRVHFVAAISRDEMKIHFSVPSTGDYVMFQFDRDRFCQGSMIGATQ